MMYAPVELRGDDGCYPLYRSTICYHSREACNLFIDQLEQEIAILWKNGEQATQRLWTWICLLFHPADQSYRVNTQLASNPLSLVGIVNAVAQEFAPRLWFTHTLHLAITVTQHCLYHVDR